MERIAWCRRRRSPTRQRVLIIMASPSPTSLSLATLEGESPKGEYEKDTEKKGISSAPRCCLSIILCNSPFVSVNESVPPMMTFSRAINNEAGRSVRLSS